MPTIMTHAVAGVAIAQAVAPRVNMKRTMIWVATLAMLPDIDVVGLRLGISYGSLLGHRGLTHSLLFAGLVGVAVSLLLKEHWRTALCLIAAITSHVILDACTNGGRGVAFFAPFRSERYFFPFTPIEVSPIGTAFFSQRGLSVLVNEILWIWIPAVFITLIAGVWRSRRERQEGGSA